MKKFVALGAVFLLSTLTAWSQILSEMCERVYKAGGTDEVMLTIESELDANGDVTDVIFTVAPHGATSSAWIRGNETTANFMALDANATRTPNGTYTQTVHFDTPQTAGTQVTFTFAWGTDLNGTCWETNQTYTLGGVCCVAGDHVNPTLTSGSVTDATNTQLTLAMVGSDQDDCGRTTSIVAYEVSYDATTIVVPAQNAAGTVFTLDGLTPGTNYALSVVAVDKRGNRSGAVTVNGQTWQHSIAEYCFGQTVATGTHQVSLVFETQWSGTPQVSNITGFTVEIYPTSEPGAQFRENYITADNGLFLNGTALVKNTDYTLTKTSPTVGTITFATPIAYDPANPPVLIWGCTEWNDVRANGTTVGRYTNDDYSISLGGNCCKTAEDNVAPVLTAVTAQGISDTQVEFTFTATDEDACGYANKITQAIVTYGGNNYPITVENGVGILDGLDPQTTYNFTVSVGDMAGNFSGSLPATATTFKYPISHYCGVPIAGEGGHPGSVVSIVPETRWSGTPKASTITGIDFYMYVDEDNTEDSDDVFRNAGIGGATFTVNGVNLTIDVDYTRTISTDKRVCTINFLTPIAYDPANPGTFSWTPTEWRATKLGGGGADRYSNVEYSSELGVNCCMVEDTFNPVINGISDGLSNDVSIELVVDADDDLGCGKSKTPTQYEVTVGGDTFVFNNAEDGRIRIGDLTPNTSYTFTVVAIDDEGNRSDEAEFTTRTWQHSIQEYCNGQTVVNGAYQVSLVFDTQWSGTPQASNITGFTVEIYPITEPGARFRTNYITGDDGLFLNGVALVKNTDYTLDTSSPTVGVITFSTPIAYDPANPPLLTWGCTEWNDVAADGTVGAGRYTNNNYSIDLGGNCCKTAEDNVAPVLTAVSAQGYSDTEMQFTFTATDQDACGFPGRITQATVSYGGNSYPITVVDGVGILGGLSGETTYNFTVTVGDLANNFSNTLTVSGTTQSHPHSEYCDYVFDNGNSQAAFTVESVFDGSGDIEAIVVEIGPAGTNTWARFRNFGIRTNDMTVDNGVDPPYIPVVTTSFNPGMTKMTIAFDTPIHQHDIVRWTMLNWSTSGNNGAWSDAMTWEYTAGGLCCMVDDLIPPVINTCPIATGEVWGNSVDLVVDAIDDNGCGKMVVPTSYEVTVNGISRIYNDVEGGSFTAFGLSPNTTQTVSVKAVDKAGNKSAACDITVTTIDKPKNYYCAPQITSTGDIPVNLLGETLWEGEPGNSSIAGIRFYISSPDPSTTVQFRGSGVACQNGLLIDGSQLTNHDDYEYRLATDRGSVDVTFTFTPPLEFDPRYPQTLTWGCTEWTIIDGAGNETHVYTNDDHDLLLGYNHSDTFIKMFLTGDFDMTNCVADDTPPVLTGATLGTAGQGQFDLNVSATDDVNVVGYRVTGEVDGEPFEVLIPVTPSTSHSGTIHVTIPDEKFFNPSGTVTVEALDAMGQKSNSMDVTVTPNQPRPTNVTASCNTTTNNSISLNVSATPGAGRTIVGYDVYYGSNHQFSQKNITPEGGVITVKYLGESLDYDLQVYAVDDWGNRSAAYATTVCTTLESNNTLCGKVLYNTTNWHTNYGNYDSRVIASASIVGDHRICVQLFPYPGTSPVTGMYFETHTDNTNPSGGRTWINFRQDWAENYPDLATYMANYNYSNNRTATVKTVTANVGGVPTQGIAVEFDYVGALDSIYFRWYKRRADGSYHQAASEPNGYRIDVNDLICNNVVEGATDIDVQWLEPVYDPYVTDTPTTLEDHPIDKTETFDASECSKLIFATNFSSSTGDTHYSLDDVEVYDFTKSATFYAGKNYSEGYANGNFMSANGSSYAIVSNPKVLDPTFNRITDGKNRMVFNLTRNDGQQEDLLFLQLENIRNSSEVTIEFDWEYVSPECVEENSYKTFQFRTHINGHSETTTYSATHDYSGHISYTAESNASSDVISLGIQNIWSYDCSAFAISNLRVYGCVNNTIEARDLQGNLACENVPLTLDAVGWDEETGFVWEEQDPVSGTWTVLDNTGASLEILPTLKNRRFRVSRDAVTTDPFDVQGVICCNSGSEVIFTEDFGTVPHWTRYQYPDNNPAKDWVKNHIFVDYQQTPGAAHCTDPETGDPYRPAAPDPVQYPDPYDDPYYRGCCSSKVDDGMYAIVSNSDYADDCCQWADNRHDHTGNLNGGFLLINVATANDAYGNPIPTLIFEKEIEVTFCPGVWYNFSIWASQLARRDQLPSNIILEIIGIDENDVETELGRVNTGTMKDYEMDTWSEYGISFDPQNSKQVLLRVYNLGQAGSGNDLAIDDISLTVCYPQIDLYTDIDNLSSESSVTCGDDVDLQVVFEGEQEKFFHTPAPYYLWQYSETIGGKPETKTWVNIPEGEDGEGSGLYGDGCNHLKQHIEGRMDSTFYRVILAGTKEIATAVANSLATGTPIAPGQCNIYAISNLGSLQCYPCDRPMANLQVHGEAFANKDTLHLCELTAASEGTFHAVVSNVEFEHATNMSNGESNFIGQYIWERLDPGLLRDEWTVLATIGDNDRDNPCADSDAQDLAYVLDRDTVTYRVQTVNGYLDGYCAKIDTFVVVLDRVPTAFTVKDTAFCKQSGTFTAWDELHTGDFPGASVRWYETENSATSITPAAVDLNTVGTTSYWVAQSNLCDGPRRQVSVTVRDLPTVDINPSATVFTCDVHEITLTAEATGVATLAYEWSLGGVVKGTAAALTLTDTPSAPVGTYIIKVTDGNGCENTAEVEITQDVTAPGLTLSSDHVQFTCDTSEIVLTATATNVEYKWTGDADYGSNATKTISAASTYSVTVRDLTNGCTSEESITIGQNVTLPAVSITKDHIQFTCDTSTIELTAVAENVTYKWNDNSTNATLAATAATDYTVEVKSTLNGCPNSATIHLGENKALPAVTITKNHTEFTCDTVSIILTAVADDVTYKWNDNSTNATLTATASDDYTVEVKSTLNGCPNSASIHLDESADRPALAIAKNYEEITCDTTAIELTAQATNVEYMWEGDADYSSNAKKTVNAASTYKVTVRDLTNGCTSEESITIGDNLALPSVSITKDHIQFTCDTSTIELTAVAENVTYKWNDNSTNATLAATAATDYTVEVKSTLNGCPNSATIHLGENKALPAVTITKDHIQFTCDTSTIELTAVAENVTYKWNDNSTNATLAATASADYTVDVKSTLNGCPNTASIHLDENTTPPALDVQASVETYTCSIPNIVLTATATNVSYVWDNNPANNTASLTLNNYVGVGGHEVKVTDLYNGCFTTKTISLAVDTIHPAVTLTSLHDTLNCYHPVTTLTATVTSTGNMAYFWNGNPGSNALPDVIAGGNYALRVLNEDNGCESNRSIRLAYDQTAPTLSIYPDHVGFTCDTTSIKLTAEAVSYALLPQGIDYAWENGPNTAEYTVSAADQYKVTATDQANGCSIDVSWTLYSDTEAPVVDINADRMQLTCLNPEANLTASSSHAVQYYRWDNGDEGANLKVVAAGEFTVSVKSALNGCPGSKNIVIGDLQHVPNVQLQPLAAVCAPEEIHLMDAIASSDPNMDFKFYQDAALTVQIPGGVVSAVGASTYYLVGSDADACEVQLPIDAVLNELTASVSDNLHICSGDQAEVSVQFTGAQKADYTYVWSADQGVAQDKRDGDLSYIVETLYETNRYYLEVLNGACRYQDTILVEVNPLPSFTIDSTQMETITVILNDDRFAPYTFDLDGAGVHQTSPEFERPQEGPHTMLVTDVLGCETEEPFWLDPKLVDIIIPPFFTPDGDGVNDLWKIGNIEHYPDAVIKIYDRFHKLIVEMDGTAEGWDGTYRGHPEPSTDYWYYIKIQELGKPRTGHITLKRLKEHD